MENQENIQQNKEQKITTPTAIIIAGFVIMLGIIISRGGGAPASKSLSEQVGVSKEKLITCIKSIDVDALKKSIVDSVDKAMSHIPKDNGRGTPYTVVIGPDGFMTEIRGADAYDSAKAIILAAKDGHLATESVSTKQADGSTKTEEKNLSEIYKGSVALSEPNDHIKGDATPVVTLIEYSDFECPFCKQFHPTLERIVKEEAPNVRWIYRNYPLHQHSFEKLVAAQCIADLKGNDAYWKYADLLFGTLKTANDSISEQL